MEENNALLKEEGFTIKESAFCMLKFFLLSTLISFVGIIFIKGVNGDNNQVALKHVIIILCNVTTYVIFLKKYYKNDCETKRRFTNSLNGIGYILIIFLWLGYVVTYSNSLGILIYKLFKDATLPELLQEISEYPIICFLSASIVAPVFEEMLFRGVILDKLLIKNKPVIAVGVSSLIFGIMHFNVVQSTNGVFLGIILGMIYCKSKSLLPCILVHFVNNTFCMLENYIPEGAFNVVDGGFNVIALIIGLLILIGCFYIFKHKEYLISKN
ncbi:CPBP family intramembrane glutamic endopeptidase [Hathewaya limosa]|uniref:Membrane protease YdiL (CAAX protease family) n=1 Tax=Hathewaya limosa TaxID=1536 RepID=A0ABU0JSK2_HATLI|nr:type II CAAX endopeptidase family protein [Hathewaya limosa]MDQ0480065.1 membrane protease YdiL (CAAX protease family) [Hathewaya limosa]